MLAALRWEYYQHYTLALLWLESMEVVKAETDVQLEIDNEMVVDGPVTCGREVVARGRVSPLSLIGEKVHTPRCQVGDDESDDIDSD